MPSRKRKRTVEDTGLLSRTKNTTLFQQYFDNTTVKFNRLIVREMGEPKWYSMKKKELVSVIVLDMHVCTIQRFVRSCISNSREREYMFEKLKGEKCPITLEPINDIPVRNRYVHTGYWFDREKLADFLHTSCDFVHPVTRIELVHQDILEIDPSLIEIYNNRTVIRASMVSRIETVQCIENELEDIYREMIDMAYYTPSRNEFNVNLTYSEVQFEECYKDLLSIDKDRCIIVLKSLPDLLEADTYTGMYISRKRGKELKALVNEFISRANDE